jgi:hypothetical protein
MLNTLYRKYKFGILRLLLCAVLIIGIYIFDYQCIFLKYLHIPCLGCGMSRAWKVAIHGHFKEAYEFHKAFWTIPIICVIILKGSLFKSKIWNMIEVQACCRATRHLFRLFGYTQLLSWFYKKSRYSISGFSGWWCNNLRYCFICNVGLGSC